MARKYDNGDLSATRRDEYLAKVHERIKGAIAVEAVPPSLDSLMANFLDAVSKFRHQTELKRVSASGYVASEDGTPIKNLLRGIGPSILAGLRSEFWYSLFDREGNQNNAANALGAHIDTAIRNAGGDTSQISEMLAGWDKLDKIDAAIDDLREHVAYIPFAVGMNNITPPSAAKLANAGNASRAIEKARHAHEKTAALVADSQDLAKTFPSLSINHVSLFTMLGSPLTSDGSTAVKAAREMLPLIDDFKQSLDKWDVMSAFETIWQNRAATCQVLGLHEEARICSEVAAQYDVVYFEALDQSWEAKPKMEAERSPAPAP